MKIAVIGKGKQAAHTAAAFALAKIGQVFFLIIYRAYPERLRGQNRGCPPGSGGEETPFHGRGRAGDHKTGDLSGGEQRFTTAISLWKCPGNPGVPDERN